MCGIFEWIKKSSLLLLRRVYTWKCKDILAHEYTTRMDTFIYTENIHDDDIYNTENENSMLYNSGLLLLYIYTPNILHLYKYMSEFPNHQLPKIWSLFSTLHVENMDTYNIILRHTKVKEVMLRMNFSYQNSPIPQISYGVAQNNILFRTY